jgi:hypothetical protein
MLLALAPAAALVGLGAAAWTRGFVSGVLLAPWEIVVLFLALALSFLGLGAPGPARRAASPRPTRRRKSR